MYEKKNYLTGIYQKSYHCTVLRKTNPKYIAFNPITGVFSLIRNFAPS
jgi:hypothetical protein